MRRSNREHKLDQRSQPSSAASQAMSDTELLKQPYDLFLITTHPASGVAPMWWVDLKAQTLISTHYTSNSLA